jgi:trehalose 6-phosphate phosphatase
MKSFWEDRAILARELAAPKLLVTLDFDGTLAALAESPGAARLTPDFRAALRSLAAVPGVSVFILSGRALSNVRALVGLRKLYYGGNHGIEIEGPDFSCCDKRSKKASGHVTAFAEDMRERFPPGTGVFVENKVLSASIHFRNIKKAYRAGFLKRIDSLARSRSGKLRWKRGRDVFEALPRAGADKGAAALNLRMHLGNPLTLAVGDDLTDEDMFLALKGRGITVRVGRKAGSHAAYFLERQSQVLRLLRFILAARRRRTR